MINNKIALNINPKDLIQKKTQIKEEKEIIKSDFNKILDEKTKNISNCKDIESEKMGNEESINSNNHKKIEDSNFEQAVKEIVEIINNDENFQGNKVDGEKIEEIVAMLNQILTLPEFKSVLPTNLENSMIVPLGNVDNLVVNSNLLGGTTEVDNVKEINTSSKKNIDVLNNISGKFNNENFKNSETNKETLNLVNNILETLNSQNIQGVLSSDEIKEFKNSLQLLSENLLNQDNDLVSKVNNTVVPLLAKEQNLGVKELKTTSLDGKIDDSNNEVIDTSTRSIITELKSNLSNKIEVPTDELVDSSDKNIITELKSNLSNMGVAEVKPIEANIGTGSYALSPEETIETSEEDKVLAKILGENESGSLNRQGTLLNRLNVRSTEVIKEPMVVSKETMDADIIKNVKFMMKNAVSELKVKVYPKELGEMTIRLLSEDGILKADIKAISKETYNLLNSNINEIKKSLEQQNIKIHEVNIGLYDDTTYYSGENNREEMFKNNENKQGKNSSKESVSLLDDLEEDEKLYDDSSVNILA